MYPKCSKCVVVSVALFVNKGTRGVKWRWQHWARRLRVVVASVRQSPLNLTKVTGPLSVSVVIQQSVPPSPAGCCQTFGSGRAATIKDNTWRRGGWLLTPQCNYGRHARVAILHRYIRQFNRSVTSGSPDSVVRADPTSRFRGEGSTLDYRKHQSK